MDGGKEESALEPFVRHGTEQERIEVAAESSDAASAIQRKKNEAAIRLLEEWMADESGYDEETWPIVQKAMEENRSSYTKRFRGQGRHLR